MSLLKKINRIPPWACRVLARKNKRWHTTPLTNLEIAATSGLSIRTVIRISHLKTWDGVAISTIDKFTRGCDIDLLKPSRHLDYLKRYKLRYIRNANPKTASALMAMVESA